MAEGHGVAFHNEELETPERSAEAIRRDIAARRDSISGTVDRLGDRLHETFDWRSYVVDYPFVALGAAAGLGLALAGVIRRRPTPRERMVEALSEAVEDLTDRFRANVGDVIPKKHPARRNALSAGLTGVAMTVASELFKRQMRDANVRDASARDTNVQANRRREPAEYDLTERTEQLEEPPANSPWSHSVGKIVI